MESANLHHHHHQHHQLQHQLVIGSSSSSSSLSTTPSWYGPSPSNHHHHATWTPNTNTTLNNTGSYNDHNSISEENLCNSRDDSTIQKHDILVVPPTPLSSTGSNISMIQDLGFQYWTSNNTAGNINCFAGAATHHQSECFPKFTEMMINTTSSSSTEDHLHLPQQAPTTTSYTKNEQKDHHFNDHLSSEKLLLKTLSSSSAAFQISGTGNNNQFSGGDQFQYSNNAHNNNNNNCSSFGGGGLLGNNIIIPSSRGSFSQIFPSINISNLSSTTTRSSSDISSSINMNLEALDLLTSARFGGAFTKPSSHDNLGLIKECPSFASHHMQQSIHRPPTSSPSYNKISPFINGVTEAKRPSNTVMEPKSSQAAAKKSRLETRACPPFKVRKEKLGDRIAALQHLVAPFGKTDTASVLMEAIGYIKFLQNQVETLSVPYMKSSRNKTHRTPQPGQTEGEGNEESKRDLRSRGLCLVPLSCMSYVTNDGGGGGGIWPHAEYHGCT